MPSPVPAFSPIFYSVFEENWSSRPVSVGKCFDFKDFLLGGSNVLEPVEKLGWKVFLEMKDFHFPKLVHAFYFMAKAFPDKGLIISTIKGVEIKFDPKVLADILKIAKGGIQVFGSNWYTKAFVCKIELIRKLFNVGNERISEIPSASRIKPEFKTFHRLCLFNLVPHTSSKDKVSNNDHLLMYYLTNPTLISIDLI